MPRVRKIECLKRVCLDYVAKAVNDWINKLAVAEATNGSSFVSLLKEGHDDELYNKHVASFLDSLPSTLILQILSICNINAKESKEDNQMLRHYLDMFFSKKIQTNWNLTGEKVDVVLQVAAKRCPELIKLDIAGLGYISLESFKPLKKLEFHLPRFQMLQELNVINGDVGDSCLEILGVHCKNLRELNVSGCCEVTDAGLAALCVSVDHLGNKNEAIGQCKSIVKLWTDGTQVTMSGIQVALQNLPVLEFWDVVSIQMLFQMHQKDLMCKKLVDIPKYSFNYLELERSLSNIGYTSGSLKMVLPFCPSLTEVHINAISGFEDADLLCLIYVEKLSKLSIEGNPVFYDRKGTEITFDNGIVPLLKAKGLTLDLLQIALVDTPININIVTALCPNLSSLSLEKNGKYITSTWNSSQPEWTDMPKLKKLVKLFLCDASRNYRFPMENLLFLLSSPFLTEITISNFETLTDDVLLTIAKVINPMLRLQKLRLQHCNSITIKGLDVFKQETKRQENEIEEICLWGCDGIVSDRICPDRISDDFSMMFKMG